MLSVLSWPRLAWQVVFVAGLGVQHAFAFDCTQAHDAIEKAICANDKTKAADDAMSAAFVRLRAGRLLAEAKALLVNQRRWLRTRSDDCTGDKRLSDCLRSSDAERTRILEARPASGPGLADSLVPVVVETPRTKQAYALGLFLLRFEHPDTAGERAFNAEVDKRIADGPRERDKDDQIGDDYEYYETASIAYASARLLSVRVGTYYWGGGPHPEDGSETINVDMATGKTLRIEDLADKAGRAAIVKACAVQYADDEKERDAANDDDIAAIVAGQLKDAVDVLTSWTFEKQNATIELGRLDGYALGRYQCVLDYSMLRRIAKSSFPLP